MSADDLLKKLEEQRIAYLETFHQVRESFDNFSPFSAELPTLPDAEAVRRSFSVKDAQSRKSLPFLPTLTDSSTLSDDSDEESEEYFVQSPLPPQSYDHEHLRNHLKSYNWDRWGRLILSTIITDRGRLKQPSLFPTNDGPAEDRSHYSHYQVFDVGTDGAPLLVETADMENAKSRATQIWHSIKNLNADGGGRRKAVGRITIAREPSPILFAALHLTMNNHFHMDELFRHLVESEASSANMHRACDEDERKQRSFIFNFEYYTIIGDDCKPMAWQLADKQKGSESHIPLSRCSSVVALSLHGSPISKFRNRSRRANTKYGFVYDPWAPWQVLNVQCYPDWRSTLEVHDSTKHYVNGPEAFLATLLTEYRDAQKRFEEIYHRITKLITPPLDFLFDEELRDKRLFEDKNFTWTRRYFWAHQTLGTMNDSIKALIDMFEDTFTQDVWEGNHKTLWPLLEEESPRNQFWKKRLKKYRHDLEKEIRNLRILIEENNARRHEIKSLRDQLYSGTSVLESRKSVELSEITIQQGHNIKLLTLVNIFFLPLTFVTSVFGMTNMPTEQHYWAFGITMATVCIPFFCLVGSLNSTSGIAWWQNKTKAFFDFVGKCRRKRKEDILEEKQADSTPLSRSTSTTEGMTIRLGRPIGVHDSPPTKIDNAKDESTEVESESAGKSTLIVEATERDALTV